MTKNAFFPLILILTFFSFRTNAQSINIYQGLEGQVFSPEKIDSLEGYLMEKLSKTNFRGYLKVQGIAPKNDTLFHYVKLSISPAEQIGDTAFIVIPKWLGKPLPSIEGKDLERKGFDAKAITKPTVLNFWFTACKPCIAEMPALNNLKEKYQGEINFLSMAPENADEIQAFLEKHDFDWRIFPDAEPYIQPFGQGYPKNIFVDGRGIIRFIFDQIPMNEAKDSFDERAIQLIMQSLR